MPAEHPLRPIRAIVDDALSALWGEFEALYSHLGRPSIPPERRLRALLLQAFYSVGSERLLMDQLDWRREHPNEVAPAEPSSIELRLHQGRSGSCETHRRKAP